MSLSLGRRLWIVLACAAVALTLAAWHARPFPGDVGLARALQSSARLPAVEAALRIVDRVNSGSDAAVVVVLIGAVIALTRRWSLVGLFAAANGLRIVSTVLKLLTHRPRPTDALVRIVERPPDFSFPSGHALGAVLCYGTLAAIAEATGLPKLARRSVQAVCVAVIVLQGVARVDLGAHWPSDVLGGYLWGVVILAPLLYAARTAGIFRP